MPVTIFFCYARKDKELLNELRTHLRPLERQGLIKTWNDGDISAGVEWEQEIKKHLDAAQIVLLLVSPAFIASDYCYGTEMTRAVERHERKEACVIPIILDHVHWQFDPLNKLQALPTDAKPVMSAGWHNLNEALFDVVQGIRNVVERWTEMQPTTRLRVSEIIQPKVARDNAIAPTAEPIRRGSPFIAPVTVEELALPQILTGHASYVYSVAISRDGQTLVSASADNTIKVWKVSTSREVLTLRGHASYVYSVAISRDGQTLVSASADNTIKVWNLSTGQLLRTLTGHTNWVSSVTISRDGETVVSASADNTIKVWNLSTGQLLRTLTGHTSYVYSVEISGDGETLVSGSRDNTIKVWNLSLGREMRTLRGHTDTVLSVAISRDGKTLVSASADKTIKVWKLPTGQEVRTLTGHTNWIYSVAVSRDGRTVVSGSGDKTIKVWGA